MGNVNMEADQIHVRDNNHKTWKTVSDALKALETSSESVVEDITELYTRDASRASKDDIAGEFSAEQAYYAGDYVYYEGSLFKFTAFHAAGEWSSEDVAPAQIGADLAAMADGVMHTYSTTERRVGTWIDDSAVYEKTQSGGITFAANDSWYDTGITGIDKLISVAITLIRDGEQIGDSFNTGHVDYVVRDNTLKIKGSGLNLTDNYALGSVVARYTKSV